MNPCFYHPGKLLLNLRWSSTTGLERTGQNARNSSERGVIQGPSFETIKEEAHKPTILLNLYSSQSVRPLVW